MVLAGLAVAATLVVKACVDGVIEAVEVVVVAAAVVVVVVVVVLVAVVLSVGVVSAPIAAESVAALDAVLPAGVTVVE
jgi:hypothetical protein